MSRYCSLLSYKRYLNSFKDNCGKNSNIPNDLKLLLEHPKENERFVDKIISSLARCSSKVRNLSNTCVEQHNSGDQYETRPKITRTKAFKREIHKLCSNLRVRNPLLWTAAGVSATGPLTKDGPQPDAVLDPIPEPPPVPETGGEEILSQLNALGEPTFVSLGLGGHTPVGFAQHCFEYLHVSLGLEWWVAIALGTLIVRLCMFPLVIMSQKNAARMNNYMPQLQHLQLKLTEARHSGNRLEAARVSQELMYFMNEKQLNPLKNVIVPLAQMPVFVSFFMALREMSNTPVDSLRTGGMWWFTDLTIPDQFYILPLITSATLFITLKVGTDGAKLSSQQGQIIQYVMKALPIVIFPFTITFPGAILCYWVSTNFVSLAQVGFLRIPKVRDYFNIEAMQKFDPTTLPVKPKGFTQGMKDAWMNAKLTKEMEERHKIDELTFQRAGRGPIAKTYKYDPTKQADPTTKPAMSAKER